MVRKTEKNIDNKYEFGVAMMKWWKQLAFLLFVTGFVVFALQLKSFQCGDTFVEKQPVGDTVNAVKGKK
jgi:hypothetical protein